MTRSLALATALALVLAGCASKKPNATPTAETVLSPTATPTDAPTSTGKPPTPKTSGPQTQAPTGPHIVFFRIKAKARCQSQGQAVTYPGSVTLEWAALNVDNVTISIDGPGVYGTYNTAHTEEFSFNCTATPGVITKHTFLLKTVGGGPVKEMTIVAEAKYI